MVDIYVHSCDKFLHKTVSIRKIMDTHLITFCSSFSPSVGIEMEKTAIKQVWSNDSYCFKSESFRPSAPLNLIWDVNGGRTTKRKIQKPSSSSSSTELILGGIILSLVILNLVIITQDFYSSVHCKVTIFIPFLQILSCIWAATAEAAPIAKPPIEKSCIKSNNISGADQIKLPPRDRAESNDDRNLSLLEMKKMIEGLSLCDLGSFETIHENLISPDKIVGLFEEDEPSLMEVKEAFDLFDGNKDGFIDANELASVLFSLGFMEASEEDCQRMIKVFDDNLDGRIDFHEFTKVLERSFSY